MVGTHSHLASQGWAPRRNLIVIFQEVIDRSYVALERQTVRPYKFQLQMRYTLFIYLDSCGAFDYTRKTYRSK